MHTVRVLTCKCTHALKTLYTFLYKLRQQTAPLATEDVGPGQAAVATTHTEVGDALLYQVEGSFQSTLTSCESLASGTANYSPTLTHGQNNQVTVTKSVPD